MMAGYNDYQDDEEYVAAQRDRQAAIEKSLDEILLDQMKRRGELENKLSRLADLYSKEERLEKAEAGCSALASWQCIHTDGMTGITSNEQGNQTCAKDKVIAEKNVEIRHLSGCADMLASALGGVKSAWESLPEGHYSPKVIQRWIVDDMHRAVQNVRAALSEWEGKP